MRAHERSTINTHLVPGFGSRIPSREHSGENSLADGPCSLWDLHSESRVGFE